MSVLRVNKKKDNYSVIDNTSLRDKKLSWKAKGMIAYLLSLPDDWQIFVSELTTHSKDGRDGTTAAIKELMDNGYIVRTDGKDEKGRFCYNYEVFEVPSPKPLLKPATPPPPPPSNPLGESRNGKTVTVNPKREDRNGESVATNGTKVPYTNEVNTNEVNTNEVNTNESLASPTVEAPEKENLLIDVQTENELDTPLRPATSFENQTKPIEEIEPKEATKAKTTEKAIKETKAGDRSKHLHQHFIDDFSKTYKTLSDGDAFLWHGKELMAIKGVREELTNLLYAKYEIVSDEKIKETFTTFMASALKDKWMKDNFSPSMLFSKFSAVIILVKKHANGSRPSSMPVYTAKTVAFTSFT